MIKPVALHICKHSRPSYWPLGIVVHHSDTPFRIKGKFVDAKMLDRFHAQRGFSKIYEGKVYHVAYHYVILPNGTVEHGRPDFCVGAHSGKTFYNKHYLGICLIGSFDPSSPYFGRGSATQPTAAQMAALQKLCVELCMKYEFPIENIIRHRDTNATYCPGRYMPFGHFMQAMRKQAPNEPKGPNYSISTSIGANSEYLQKSNEGINHINVEKYHVVSNATSQLRAITCQEDH